MQSIFAPAVESLARCFPGTGGKITVHVTTKNGRFHVDIDPSAILDASSRACAESVLANVYREQTGENGGGPEVPPSGFTSLVTFVW